jgi:hypothetical protein
MASRAVKFGPLGNFKKLNAGDIESILRLALD